MMANEPGVGRMLPQDSPAQSYMFVPSGIGSRENQKSGPSSTAPFLIRRCFVVGGALAETARFCRLRLRR